MRDIVGRERVIAGTDCGFGSFAGYSRVDPGIAYKKLERARRRARRSRRTGYGEANDRHGSARRGNRRRRRYARRSSASCAAVASSMRAAPSDFLRFVVERDAGRRRRSAQGLHDRHPGFGRPPDFDAQSDPLVRVEALRLRQRLDRVLRGRRRRGPREARACRAAATRSKRSMCSGEPELAASGASAPAAASVATGSARVLAWAAAALVARRRARIARRCSGRRRPRSKRAAIAARARAPHEDRRRAAREFERHAGFDRLAAA